MQHYRFDSDVQPQDEMMQDQRSKLGPVRAAGNLARNRMVQQQKRTQRTNRTTRLIRR